MTKTLKVGQTVRIFRIRENGTIANTLAEQSLPRWLVGATVRISSVGEFGTAFYPAVVNNTPVKPYGYPGWDPNEDREYHVFFERAPRIFNMETVQTPVTPITPAV
jgi:hypothetical protein